MKKLLVLASIALVSVSAAAQYEEEGGGGGFQKEKLFTGGSVTLSFFNGQTLLGANPMFGYQLTDFIDAGVTVNVLYNGSRDFLEYNDKVRQTIIGPGVFTRIYPVRFLFVQGQFERNFTTQKYIPAPGGSYGSDKMSFAANSFLVGGGIAQGRAPGSNTFFYLSLLVDVLKDIRSPYVNVTVDPNNPAVQRKTMVPVIRGGVNVGLFQGRYR